ncbi:hypothetical protein KSP35_05715 [Aquihabitans sp. G128]|uniref:hypothetical protein n=1 Tax=Aquihabitans sp. G128 TaxID=2849779 RepID=UPI001C235948|nr:hypothetical protein [Aquihabitans sp. G128]QXC62301.1 hypothetical protein KSP35_05715 [Aquihabitans sp. G128]
MFRPARPARHLVTLVAAAAVLSVSATACLPTPAVTWKLGDTHGVVIETGAQRGSLNIYRSPRSALMQAWKLFGIDGVMAGMWAYGKAPRFSICAFAVCLDQTDVNNKIHGWIYGDPWDLKGALFDAQNNYNCLALTIISHGVYNKNWTNKSVGCRLGSVDSTANRAATEPAGRGSVLVVEGGEPDDPGDRPPGSMAPMPGPPEPARATRVGRP